MAGIRDYDYANAARTLGQGVTYGFGDEIEAALRAAAQGDPKRYAMLRDQIRRQQEGYSEANPGVAIPLEMAGMLGGALLTPAMAAPRALGALSRAAPRATKFIGGALEDAAQGALYAAGQAPEVRDIPQTIREEAPANAVMFGGMSALGAGGKRLLRAAPVKSRLERLMEMLRNR
jgi:hypothetical protein